MPRSKVWEVDMNRVVRQVLAPLRDERVEGKPVHEKYAKWKGVYKGGKDASNG